MRSLLTHSIFLTLLFVPSSVKLQADDAKNQKRTEAREGKTDEPSIAMIWNKGKHNAFTDLIRYHNAFYCTFRESAAHVPRNHAEDGTIRVIRSEDGTEWKSFALLKEKGVDLRDPKISITPDDRLMIVMGGSFYESRELLKRNSRVSFLDKDSQQFSKPVPIVLDKNITQKNQWLWRVTWEGKTGYGVVYQANSANWGHHLVKTTDGIHYSLVQSFELKGKPNETTVRFAPDGTMWIVARNEDGKQRGHLGHSQPPYTDIKWTDIPQRLGGPNLRRLPNGTWVLGSRNYLKRVSTRLDLLKADGSVKRILELPSGGDTSYPGMLVHDGKLWASYYSSHEGKTSIYLARVPLSAFE